MLCVRQGGRKGQKRAQWRKTRKVTKQTFHLRNLRQTTLSFYSPLSQAVTVWGFLLVRGVTLHTGYCPAVSHSAPQLSDFSPKPPWRKVKASFQAGAGFTAALCSSLIAAFFQSLNIIWTHLLTQSPNFLSAVPAATATLPRNDRPNYFLLLQKGAIHWKKWLNFRFNT